MPLFKYAPAMRVDVIERLRICFSPPSAFNDPFELLPDTRLVETTEWIDQLAPGLVQEIRALNPHVSAPALEALIRERYRLRMPEQKRIALEAAREMHRDNRILSLCKTPPEDPAALLMWGHYTDNHRGLVFEFDESHPWVTGHRYRQGEPHDLQEVIYDEKRTGWNGITPRNEFMFTKSPHWEYEKEVRLFRFARDPAFQSTEHVDSLLPFPPELLRSVTLGVNHADRASVVRTLNANPQLAHVALRQAERHVDEFRLTLLPIAR